LWLLNFSNEQQSAGDTRGKKMYIIGQIKPLNSNEIDSIKNLVSFELPKDYLAFLSTYGYGGICDFLLFEHPDKQYLKNNFGEYMDFWNWQNKSEIDIALNGLTISTNIDGDIICCIDKPGLVFLVLPRHSQKPIYFDSLENVILHFSLAERYFTTHDSSKTEWFSMVKNGKLDENRISKIQQEFLRKYMPDIVFNENVQPKYILQEIGGWVSFDLVYQSGISVKYQTIFEQKACEIIELIKQYI
jgi:hypothetical protein